MVKKSPKKAVKKVAQKPAKPSPSKKVMSKKVKISPKLEKSLEKAEEELEEIGGEMEFTFDDSHEKASHEPVEESKPNSVSLKASKPIGSLRKGDKVVIDGKTYEVDAHTILIDHGSTQEMALELFDPKTDTDYQLRYFSDQVETSLELYELQEIVYVRKQMSTVVW